MRATLTARVVGIDASWWVLAGALVTAVSVGIAVARLDSLLLLAALVAAIPIIWILTDYRAGVMFLTFTVPIAGALPQFRNFNLVGYFSLATLASFGFEQFSKRKTWHYPPAWLIGLYVLPVTVATVRGAGHIHDVPYYMVAAGSFGFPTASAYVKFHFLYPMLTLVWAWMLMHAIRDSQRPQRYVWLLLSAAMVPALILLVAVATSGLSIQTLASDEGTREFLGPTGFHANELGLLLTCVFGPLLFAALAARSVGARLLLWVMLGIVTTALVLSFSRGAYVGAAVAVLVFLLRSPGRLLQKVLVVLAVGALAAPLSGPLIERASTGWSGTASADTRASAVTASRTDIWRAVWPEVEAHPFAGTGSGSTAWSTAAHQKADFVTHPHNMYLEILLDMGAVGLVLLLGFYMRLGMLLHQTSKATQRDPIIGSYLQGAFAGFAGYMVSVLANGHYMPVQENAFLWASLGVALACWPAARDAGPSPARA